LGTIGCNQTLFVGGIHNAIKNEELKHLLFELFSAYGEIVDIRCGPAVTRKTRGACRNAFVVFSDVTNAKTAKDRLQSFEFFGPSTLKRSVRLRVDYAKTKSDRLAMLDGTYKPRKMQSKEDKTQTRALAAQKGTTLHSIEGVPLKDGEKGSHKLCVENLPEEITEAILEKLFKQYPGYLDITLASAKRVAFIEYTDDKSAGVAMNALQGFLVTKDNALKISYAK